MQTLAGTGTLGYPVGVFNVHGKLLGNAAGSFQYVSIWNADTADARIGTLAAGGDPLHFNMTLNTGMSLPAGVSGCRYYQMDLIWNKFDGVRNWNGCYVDWGDGTGMRLAANLWDPLPSLPPFTTQSQTAQPQFDRYAYYFVHTYPDTTNLKTITFYHNDGAENAAFDNLTSPAASLSRVKNFRGNLPQHIGILSGNSFQQASMMTVANITNWNSIHTIYYFGLGSGDGGVTPAKNASYAQDFMAGNKDLDTLSIGGYYDSTLKLSRFKSDWNTYFSHLKYLSITDAQWNREDLSSLKELHSLVISPGSNPPLPSGVVNNILIQMAAGGGQAGANGTINMKAGTGTRSGTSDAAVQFLLSKGWIVIVNGVIQANL
jgi:hypothetical protein